MNIDHLLSKHAPDTEALAERSAGRKDAVLAGVEAAETNVVRLAPRKRRRRTLVGVGAVAASLAAVVSAAALYTGGSTPASAAQQRFVNADAQQAYQTYGAFSAGKTVYIGNRQVTFDEKIKAIYYTSEGVLVRTGKVSRTDDGRPSHYELVKPDGSHLGIELKMGDRVVGTNPQSPYVAYAEPAGQRNRWDFVVVDLTTSREVARTRVAGKFTWGGWEAPPVTTAGQRMWALMDKGWVEYDFASDTTRVVPQTGIAQGAVLDAANGRYVIATGELQNSWEVRDFASGKVVRGVESKNDESSMALSPDARYVQRSTRYAGYDEAGNLIEAPGPFTYVNVESGEEVVVDQPGPLGWTPTGNALTVNAKDDTVTVCYPTSGSCDVIDWPISGTGKVKLGGTSYES